MSKRCQYCGRYFVADRRVGARQKACSDPICRRKRKRQAQSEWARKNPGYFAGRYGYIKQRRQDARQRKAAHGAAKDKTPKVIQDKIPLAKPYQELILLIPEDKTGVIQDEIRLRRVAPSTFAAFGG